MAAFIDILEAPTAGLAGHIASSTAAQETLCRITDAAVNSGLFVCEGATPGTTCKVPSTSAEALASLGVLIDPEFLNDTSAATQYLVGQQATILQRGYIWVECEETVAYDDPVFVRFASGAGGTVLGKVRNDADTTTAVSLPGARFASARTGAGIVKVKLQLQQR
jgi:hypothetical protein